jgi:hypothetical protein
LGGLVYTPDKLEQVVQAIENIVLSPKMVVFLYFATSPPDNTPTILVTPFYYGSETEGRAAFKPFFDIGPVADTTTVLPYNQWNAGANGFCIKGGRKPVYAAGFNKMIPSTWRQIWNEFTSFAALPGAQNSAVLVECYPRQGYPVQATDASFAGRDIRYNSAIVPWYSDPSLDTKAAQFGSQARDQLRAQDGYPKYRTYATVQPSV